MPAPSVGKKKRRVDLGLYELLKRWWRRRVSFLLSLTITLCALAIYHFVFLQERRTPFLEFVQRLELDTLDTRFRYRPRRFTSPDPRIVIVDIDQRSQEILGKWPFSRKHFAAMLDALREDGAKVAAFDITFSKPDQSAAPIRAFWTELEERRKKGESIDSKLVEEVRKLAGRSDADAQFAEAIRRFGPVILGNFFLYTEADMRGIDDATLDAYANQLSFFAFPSVIGTREGFKKEDRVRLIGEFAGAGLLPKGTEANIEPITSALSGGNSWTGFFNAPPDVDGVVRRATLILPYGRSQNFEDWDLFASLDVMAARAVLALKPDETILRYGQTGIQEIQFGTGLGIRPDERGQILINYQGPTGSFAHYSMADVARGKFARGTFRDKLVLVGATATGIGDLRATPHGGTDYPGVEIHANVIDNILNRRFLERGARQGLIDVLFVLAFGIPVGIWMALVSPRWMWFGLGLLLPLALVNYWAFLHGWCLNFSVPAMTLGSNVLLVSLYRALVEEKEKQQVHSAFGQYLSPEVIRRLLINPRLVEPRKTEITVMFTDIRGFTTISENLEAQELAGFLNRYLTDMTRIVFDHDGTLDKYVGDAVMAFWGAPFEEPDQEAKACEAALKMMESVRALQAERAAKGQPPLDIGIGINTGVASVGNMGSALRYGYTAIGDCVNLASRLEGLNKEYSTHILVNETTYASVKDAGFFFRDLDLIRVQGKHQPVRVYELMGRQTGSGAGASAGDLRERLEKFARARALYQQRNWTEALGVFEEVLARWPDDAPSKIYRLRCKEYLAAEPPANWDGVFTMTHK
jgi:adenylate cyclase